MKPLDFCASCGSRLTEADAEGGKRCVSCERVWYRNAAPTAGCVIVRDGKALVTKRARDPEKGRFDIPGGFLHHDEHPLDGLRREVREELGIEVEAGIEDCLQMVPHSYGHEGDYVLAMGFKARHVSGEPSANDDVEEFRWVDLTEVDQLDFAWEHDRELVRKVLGDG